MVLFFSTDLPKLSSKYSLNSYRHFTLHLLVLPAHRRETGIQSYLSGTRPLLVISFGLAILLLIAIFSRPLYGTNLATRSGNATSALGPGRIL